jgi:ABC-type transport system substrate-binding protein
VELRRRRLLPSLRALAFVFAVCLLAASCTAAPVRTGSDTPPTVPGGHVLDTSGTVTVGVRSLQTNFNPATPAGDNPITRMVMEQVWPQPFVTDPTFPLPI